MLLLLCCGTKFIYFHQTLFLSKPCGSIPLLITAAAAITAVFFHGKINYGEALNFTVWIRRTDAVSQNSKFAPSLETQAEQMSPLVKRRLKAFKGYAGESLRSCAGATK